MRGNCGASNHDSQRALVADYYYYYYYYYCYYYANMPDNPPERDRHDVAFPSYGMMHKHLSNRTRFPNTADVVTKHVLFHTVVRA